MEYFAGKTADNIDSGRIDLKKAEKKNQRYRKVYSNIYSNNTVSFNKQLSFFREKLNLV